MRTVMKYLYGILVFLVVSLVSLFPAAPVDADANSVTVTPSEIIDSVSSGSSRNYSISVTNGFALTAEVAGLGETPAGAPVAVSPGEDTSPFTARPWVSIDKTRLDPGNNQTLAVTVSVPSGVAPGERYAAIYLRSQPTGGGNAAIVSGVLIPLIFIVDETSFVRNISGQITDLKVANAYRGKPIDILTSFRNNGNCRITNARITVTIKDSAGNTKWENERRIPSPSVIPHYPRVITTTYSTGLGLGNYTVTSTVTLETGAVYSRTIDFRVVEPPSRPVAPTPLSPGNATLPGPVIDSLTPSFQWSPVAGAEYYTLTVTRDPYEADNTVYTSNQITATSFELPSGVLFDGEKYGWYVQAHNVSGSSDGSVIFYFQTPREETPSVTTLAPSSITHDSAVLNCNVTSLGDDSSVEVSFEYGTTTAYGQTTPPTRVTSAGPYSTTITGLTPNTTYHFRAKLVGSVTVYGNDLTFATSPPPTTPAVTPTPTPSPSPTVTSTPVATPTPVPGGKSNYSKYLLPGLDEASLVIRNFTDQEIPYVDAISEAGVQVVLSEPGNGIIAVGRYKNVPSTEIGFNTGVSAGGTGKYAIKYVDVLAEGFIRGTATVTVYYTGDELGDIDPNTLLLSYYYLNRWRKCDNIRIAVESGSISGEIPVTRLSGTIIGLGGELPETESLPVQSTRTDQGGIGISWSLVGITVASTLIIGSVLLAIVMGRRRNPSS